MVCHPSVNKNILEQGFIREKCNLVYTLSRNVQLEKIILIRVRVWHRLRGLYFSSDCHRCCQNKSPHLIEVILNWEAGELYVRFWLVR